MKNIIESGFSEDVEDEVDPVRAKLKEQFDNPKVITLEKSKKITLFDINPERQDEETKEPEVATLYFKGMITTAEAQEEFLIELAAQNERVLAVNEQFGIDVSHLPESDKMAAAKKIISMPRVELERVAAAALALKSQGVEKVKIVSQSMGAIEAMIFALLYPEIVESIVLVSPAGMTGKDSKIGLFNRFQDNIARQKEATEMKLNGDDPNYRPDRDTDLRIVAKREEEHKEKSIAEGMQAVEIGKKASGLNQYIKSDPLGALETIAAIADADIMKAIQFLRDEYRIKIGIIGHVDDRIYSPKDIYKNVSRNQVDAAIMVEGVHSEFIINPAEEAVLIKDLFTNFARQRREEPPQK